MTSINTLPGRRFATMRSWVTSSGCSAEIELRKDFSKHAQLLEGVDTLDRQVDVKPSGSGCLHEYFQAEPALAFRECASNGQDIRKFGAVGRIEIEEKVVRMFLVVATAGPWIMVDATQSGEIEQRRKIVRDYVLDVFAFHFGWDCLRFRST